MPSLKTPLWTAALLHGAYGSNTVFRIPVTKRYVLSGRVQHLTSISEPDETFLSATHAHPSKGIIRPLHDDMEIYYYSTISLGTPPQPFEFVLDTGSATLWIPSEECTSCLEGDWNPSEFSKAKSSTYRDLHTPFEITYGVDNATRTYVSGNYGTETVTWGDYLVLEDTPLGVVSYQQQFGRGLHFDGILGLAFEGLLQGKTESLLHLLEEKYSFPEPVFSFRMTDQQGRPLGEKCEFVLGERLVDPIVWVPVSMFMPPQGTAPQYFWWASHLEGHFNDKRIGRSLFVVDSGTSAIVVPQALCDELQFNPRTITKMSDVPRISFEIGGYEYILERTDFILSIGKEQSAMIECGGRMWILGDVFHRKYMVTYDFMNHRFGLPMGKKLAFSIWNSATWPWWAIFAFAVIAAALSLVSYLYRRRRSARQARNEETIVRIPLRSGWSRNVTADPNLQSAQQLMQPFR